MPAPTSPLAPYRQLQDDPTLWPWSLQAAVQRQIDSIFRKARQRGDSALAREAEQLLNDIHDKLRDSDCAEARALAALLDATLASNAGAALQQQIARRPALQRPTVAKRLGRMAARAFEIRQFGVEGHLWAAMTVWMLVIGKQQQTLSSSAVESLNAAYGAARRYMQDLSSNVFELAETLTVAGNDLKQCHHPAWALSLLSGAVRHLQYWDWEWKPADAAEPNLVDRLKALAYARLGEARYTIQRQRPARVRDCTGAVEALSAARPLLKALYDAEPDTWRSEYPLALARLGGARLRQQKWASAEQAYVEARPLLKALYDADKEKWRHDYALALANLGGARLRQQKWASAEQAYVEARPLLKALYNAEPDTWRSQYPLTLLQLGGARLQQQKWASGEDALAEAEPLLKALYDADKEKWRSQYPLTLLQLGEARLRQQKSASGEDALAEAEPLLKALYDADKEKWRHNYALSLANLGEARLRQQKWTSAEDTYAAARPRLKALYDADKEEWRHDYTVCCLSLGVAAFNQGKPRAALQAFGDALRITEAAAGQLQEQVRTHVTQDMVPEKAPLGAPVADGLPRRLREVFLRWKAYVHRARILATNDWPAARTSLETAVEEIDAIRAELPTYEARVTWQRKTVFVIEALKDLSLAHGDAEALFRWHGLKARTWAEVTAARRARG